MSNLTDLLEHHREDLLDEEAPDFQLLPRDFESVGCLCFKAPETACPVHDGCDQ